MAVKVMVAPAIAKAAEQKAAPARRSTAPGEAPKPKRRRSSVYDADGNEVFITLMCLKCHKMRPLSQFGLRKMADGAIRNQPWCRTCRSAAGTKGKERESAEMVESPVLEGAVERGEPLGATLEPASAPVPDPAAAENAPRPGSGGRLAAEVAAALSAGLGR